MRRGKSNIIYETVYDRRIANRDHSYRFCTFTSNEKEARRITVEREREIKAGLDRGVQPSALLCERLTTARMLEIDLERFLTKRPVSPEQKRNLEDFWRQIGIFFKDYHHITSHQLYEFYKWLRGPDPSSPVKSNQTIIRYMHALKRTLKLCATKRYGYAVEVPEEWPDCSQFDPKDETKSGRKTTPEDMDAFFRRIAWNPRLFTFMFFCVSTGLRFEEANKVTLALVRDPNESVPDEIVKILHVPAEIAKDRRPRDVPLTREALAALRTMGRRPYVVQKAVRDNCAAIGLAVITARSCRTALYEGTRKCGDILGAKLMAGHKQRDSSDHYIRGSDQAIAAAGLALSVHYRLPDLWLYRIAAGTFQGYVRKKHAARLQSELRQSEGTGTGHRYSTGTIVELTKKKTPYNG